MIMTENMRLELELIQDVFSDNITDIEKLEIIEMIINRVLQ
jgi:hypothetical protein